GGGALRDLPRLGTGADPDRPPSRRAPGPPRLRPPGVAGLSASGAGELPVPRFVRAAVGPGGMDPAVLAGVVLQPRELRRAVVLDAAAQVEGDAGAVLAVARTRRHPRGHALVQLLLLLVAAVRAAHAHVGPEAPV